MLKYKLRFQLRAAEEWQSLLPIFSIFGIQIYFSSLSFFVLHLFDLTLSLPNLGKSKFQPNVQISFCEILKNKQNLSTGRELSFEWSHHRISSADSKVRVISQNSIKHSGSERVNSSYQLVKLVSKRSLGHKPRKAFCSNCATVVMNEMLSINDQVSFPQSTKRSINGHRNNTYSDICSTSQCI